MKTRPINEYDILKAFAIILVVIGHITILFTPDSHPQNNTKLAQYITFGIYLFHMPLFMSISGAVYQLSKNKPQYQRFWPFVINKLKRIIIPYYLIGICALLPVLVYINAKVQWSDAETWFKILLAKDCRHLWYLLALFWIFLLQFTADKLRINLWALFVFSSILTLAVSWFVPDLNFMCINMALRKWPCFILGMLMARNYSNLPIYKALALPISGGVICAVTVLMSTNYYIDMIFSLLMPYCICAVLIAVARQLSLSETWGTIIREIAGYSFGIYLFHVMVIFLLRHWFDGYLDMWMLMAVMFIASIGISIGLTKLLRRIHFGFMIGE